MSAYYNENDPKTAAWLRELIKEHLIADGEVDTRSIVDVEPADLTGFAQCHFFAGIGGWSYALRLAGWPDEREVWTGSCPCQPWSVAGSGQGAADPRHLWPAWFALIRECGPAVIFGEQTSSLDGRYWLDLVYADLEARGYAIGAVDLPACSIGAPHKRARLWFVAHADSEQLRAGGHRESPAPARATEGRARERQWRRDDVGQHRAVSALDHAERDRTERIASGKGRAQPTTPCGRQDERRGRLQACDTGDALSVGDTHGARLALRSVNQDGPRAVRIEGAAISQAGATRGFWADCEWLWHRDGVYRAIEPGTFPLATRVPGDMEQIHGYGNAIVPQVAAEVIGAYMDLELELLEVR